MLSIFYFYLGVRSLHGPHHVAEKSTIVGAAPSAIILVLNCSSS